MYFYTISCRYPDGNCTGCRGFGYCPCHFSPVRTIRKKEKLTNVVSPPGTVMDAI